MPPVVPHAWLELPWLQVSEGWPGPAGAAQQPVEQLVGVQTQVPFWHSRPRAAQFMQMPPVVPHAWLLFWFPGRQTTEG